MDNYPEYNPISFKCIIPKSDMVLLSPSFVHSTASHKVQYQVVSKSSPAASGPKNNRGRILCVRCEVVR